jgi:hypothetical protein
MAKAGEIQCMDWWFCCRELHGKRPASFIENRAKLARNADILKKQIETRKNISFVAGHVVALLMMIV